MLYVFLIDTTGHIQRSNRDCFLHTSTSSDLGISTCTLPHQRDEPDNTYCYADEYYHKAFDDRQDYYDIILTNNYAINKQELYTFSLIEHPRRHLYGNWTLLDIQILAMIH